MLQILNDPFLNFMYWKKMGGCRKKDIILETLKPVLETFNFMQAYYENLKRFGY